MCATSPDNRKLEAQCHRNDLAPGVHLLNERNVIVYSGPDGTLRAALNRCNHEGGRFRPTHGCIVTCPNHGWQLDLSMMEYTNPVGVRKQPELEIEQADSGIVSFYSRVEALPWDESPMERQQLGRDELTVRFLAHACVEIQFAGRTLFTDPWLTGPAFTRGWWLSPLPPRDWLERLSKADWIYISHNHSDHLNQHTLRLLADRNPGIPVFVPDFAEDSCVRFAMESGMRNVRKLPFGTWHPLMDDARLMILPDGTGRDDSGLLFEYKGHRILNIVDCSDINRGVIPHPVDMLMTSFAGGSTGYPVCWGDLYSAEHIEQVVRKNRMHMIGHAVAMAKASEPACVMPFAGYFTEAHPSDREIQRVNVKNQPQDVAKRILKACPETEVWIPQPGSVRDLGTGTVTEGASGDLVTDYEFERYLAPIRASLEFEPLQSLDGVLDYFVWTGYRGDVIIHIVETDDTFNIVVRECMIDLAGPKIVARRPDGAHRYLRMRVRADVFRHVLQYGLPWEEISIGFQGRFYREPDVYNFDFWDHFQNKLPKVPLWRPESTTEGEKQAGLTR